MESVGIGLIGTGFMGKCHAVAYNAVGAVFADAPRPRLEILADMDRDQAEARARGFGFARATDDWLQVVNDPAVDVVSITTPNALHKPMALAAIAAGKHVYLEKPMALNLAEASEISAAAGRAGVKSLVGYNYLRSPAVQHAKRLIDGGNIGRIVAFRGSFDEDYMADPELPFSWRCRRSEAGSGALGDMACHLISIANLLLGPIASVMAEVWTEHSPRPGPPGTAADGGAVENDDAVHALVRFQNGVSGVMLSSRIAWGFKNRLSFEVHGSEGTLTFDHERMNELRLFRAEGDSATRGFRTILSGPEHPPFGSFVPAPGHGLGFNDLKVIEVAHLLRGIAGREPLHPNFDDALHIEHVMGAIERSHEQEAWISI